jgi:hypothetical protein
LETEAVLSSEVTHSFFKASLFPFKMYYIVFKHYIFHNLIRLYEYVDQSKYDNLQHTHALTSVSLNPWHPFVEPQGSEEPNLKNTAIGDFFNKNRQILE